MQKKMHKFNQDFMLYDTTLVTTGIFQIECNL